MSELLTLGDVTDRYQSRSEAAMAIALAAGNARWGIDDLRAALLDERNEGGAWLRVRKRNGAPRLDIELRLHRKAPATAARWRGHSHAEPDL